MSLKYEKLIRKMTLAEKAVMMSGKNTWETVDFEKYEFRRCRVGPTDGLRKKTGRSGRSFGIECQSSNLFSDSGRSGNSWDEALGEEIGEALAEEAVTMGVNVILGPGLNIKTEVLVRKKLRVFFRGSISCRKWRRHMFVESKVRELQPARSILQQTVRSCALWRTIRRRRKNVP